MSSFWSKSFPEEGSDRFDQEMPTPSLTMLAFEECGIPTTCENNWKQKLNYLQLDPLIESHVYLEWFAALTKGLQSADSIPKIGLRYHSWNGQLKSIAGLGLTDLMSLMALRGEVNSVNDAVSTGYEGRDALTSDAIFHLSLQYLDRRRQLISRLAASFSIEGKSNVEGESFRLDPDFSEWFHKLLGMSVPYRSGVRILVKSEATESAMSRFPVLNALYIFYAVRQNALWSGSVSEGDKEMLLEGSEPLAKILSENSASELEDKFGNELQLLRILENRDYVDELLASHQASPGGFLVAPGIGQEPQRDVQPKNETFYRLMALDSSVGSFYQDIISEFGTNSLSFRVPLWLEVPSNDKLEAEVLAESLAAVWLGFKDPATSALRTSVNLNESEALRLSIILGMDFATSDLLQQVTSRNTVALGKMLTEQSAAVLYGKTAEATVEFSAQFEAVRKGTVIGQKLKYAEFYRRIIEELSNKPEPNR